MLKQSCLPLQEPVELTCMLQEVTAGDNLLPTAHVIRRDGQGTGFLKFIVTHVPVSFNPFLSKHGTLFSLYPLPAISVS